LSSLEHGEGGHKAGHEAVIGLNVQGVLDCRHLQADVLQGLIVVDIESRHRLQVVDTLERAQTSVGNQNAVGLSYAGATK